MTRYSLGLGFIAIAGLAMAQVQPSQGGWRRVGDPPPSLPVPQQSQAQAQDPSEPIDRSDQFGQPIQDNPQALPEPQQPPRMNDRPPYARPAYGLPPEVT